MKKIFNILLGAMIAITVVLAAYAMAMGGSDEAVKGAVSLNLMWAYFLFAFAIGSALFCAVIGMMKSSGGAQTTLIAVGFIAIVVGAAYFIANGQSIPIPNIEKGGFFAADATVIANASNLVTYFSFA